MLERNEISNKLAIEFILDSNNTLRIPFSKIISSCNYNELNFSQKQLTRLNDKIDRHGKLDDVLSVIHLDKVNALKVFSSIEEIKFTAFSKQKELLIIAKNIKNFDKNELSQYVKNEAFQQFKSCENDNLKTEFRKLFLAYDLITHGDVNKIT